MIPASPSLVILLRRLAGLAGFSRGLKQSAQSSATVVVRVNKAQAEATARTYLKKLFAGDRATLSRSITLVESMRPDRRAEGAAILAGIMKRASDREHDGDHTQHTLRLGTFVTPSAPVSRNT